MSDGLRRSYYEDLDRRKKPITSADAKFSLPFVLGVSLDRGDVLLEDFSALGRENQRALMTAQKVKSRCEEKYKREGIEIGAVEIVLKNGKKYSQEVPFAYGHPENPIKKEDLRKKFRDCAKYSGRPLTGERVEEIIKTVEDLEKVAEMREFVSLLS